MLSLGMPRPYHPNEPAWEPDVEPVDCRDCLYCEKVGKRHWCEYHDQETWLSNFCRWGEERGSEEEE